MPKIFLCLLHFFILINLIYGASNLNNNPDEIKSLPGLNENLNFKHYSGKLFNCPYFFINFILRLFECRKWKFISLYFC